MKVASMLKCMKYPPVDITPETRLYIPFNEGVDPNGSISMAKDYSQYNNHATLTDVEWSPDGFNGAGEFNGTSAFGDCGNDASLDIKDALNIEAWVKINELNRMQYITEKEALSTYAGTLYVYTDNKFGFYIWDGNFNPTIYSDSIYGLGQYHVVVVRNIETDKIYLYINGEEAATPITDTTTTSITNDIPLRIGSGSRSPTGRYFNGSIDNIIIRSVARSIAQTAADCYEVVCA